MALINKSNIIQEAIRLLLKSPIPTGVGLFSYKRNRKVYLLKKDEDTIFIKEDGYVVTERHIQMKKLEKELRAMVKREFPRSRKIRLYKLNSEITDLDYQKI